MNSREFVSSILKTTILSLAAIMFFASFSSYAQSTRELHPVPTAVVEVPYQYDCPIATEPVAVEASLDGLVVDIKARLRNISNKSIFGLVTSINNSTRGNAMFGASLRADGLISVSGVSNNQYRVEFGQRNSSVILPADSLPPKVVFSIDYVKFIDGSSWGNDWGKRSTSLNDALKGAQAAVSDLLNNYPNPGPNDIQKMKELLKDRLAGKSPLDNGESKDQSSAYFDGYRNVASILNGPDCTKPDAFLKKLEELQTSLIESNSPNQ